MLAGFTDGDTREQSGERLEAGCDHAGLAPAPLLPKLVVPREVTLLSRTSVAADSSEWGAGPRRWEVITSNTGCLREAGRSSPRAGQLTTGWVLLVRSVVRPVGICWGQPPLVPQVPLLIQHLSPLLLVEFPPAGVLVMVCFGHFSPVGLKTV